MDDETSDPSFEELFERLKPLIDKKSAMKRSLSPLDLAYWTLGKCYALHETLNQRGGSQFARDQLVRALQDALRCVQELKEHPERSN